MCRQEKGGIVVEKGSISIPIVVASSGPSSVAGSIVGTWRESRGQEQTPLSRKAHTQKFLQGHS